MELVGGMLRREPAVGGDDLLARRRPLHSENSQPFPRLAFLREERDPPDAIRLPRTRRLRVIDVVETVLLPQPGEGVGLESEGEAEVEQVDVLQQRDRAAGRRDELDRDVEELRALRRRRMSGVALRSEERRVG